MIVTNSKEDLLVSESIEVIKRVMTTLKDNKDKLEDHIKAVNSGLIVQDISYVKLYDEILNEYTKIRETVIPIYKYSKLSVCSDDVLENIKIKTLKGIIINEITIKRLIPTENIIPNFKIKITNLGLIGLAFTDTISVTLVNDDSRESSNITFNSPIAISKINERAEIEVSGLVSINKEAVCDLVIEFRDASGLVFLNHVLKGINVYSGGEVLDSSEI